MYKRRLAAIVFFAALPVLLLAKRVDSQQAAPVAQAFRDNAREIGQNILFAAEAMPAGKYSFKPTGARETFAAVALSVTWTNDYYCAVIRGLKPPNRPNISDTAGKSTVIARLRETTDYCGETLAGLDDASLGAPTGGAGSGTRAAAMIEATLEWADLYRQLGIGLRLNGLVPPRRCKVGGNGGCDSGAWSCHTATPGTGHGGTFVLSDAPYSIRSDGGGIYRNGDANSRVVIGIVANLQFFVTAPADAKPLRAITVDLEHPVPGDIGVPLGVVTADTNLELTTQWYTEADYTQHNLFDIPVGTTVDAKQMNVAFHIKGVAHALQMGPQPLGHCAADGSAMHGDGTTMGTISHPSATQWIVDLPVGSIGRLFDIHLLEPNAINKGLYYVSLHYVVRK
jgi:DinB family protein